MNQNTDLEAILSSRQRFSRNGASNNFLRYLFSNSKDAQNPAKLKINL